MDSEYLLVKREALPECYSKVAKAKKMLELGEVSDVSEAAQKVGISRSTFYKYKDHIVEPTHMTAGQHAVLSIMLQHEKGTLSSLLTIISGAGASVITINQSMPIHDEASVTFSLDISNMNISVSELITLLDACPGARKPKMIAIE